MIVTMPSKPPLAGVLVVDLARVDHIVQHKKTQPKGCSWTGRVRVRRECHALSDAGKIVRRNHQRASRSNTMARWVANVVVLEHSLALMGPRTKVVASDGNHSSRSWKTADCTEHVETPEECKCTPTRNGEAVG